MNKNKIIIVGSGAVGASYAFNLVVSGIGDSVGIIDINLKKALGDVLDLEDALAFYPHKKMFQASYEDCFDADLVVITAGVAQKQGGETRLELLKTNISILKDVTERVVSSGFKGIFLVVSNPVDIMTYVVLKYSHFPKNRVIGTGTVLDTARLRKELSMDLNIDTGNIHAYIMGEHGDSEFAVWSNAFISAIPIREWLTMHGVKNIDNYLIKKRENARRRAYNIIDLKGSTYYGIAGSLTKITKAILKDERVIMTVSCYLDGEFDVRDVVIGVPAIIDSSGIKEVIDLKLSKEEQVQMNNSVHVLKDVIQGLEL